MRPLGIPALEDKLVQAGLVKILQGIYEQDFIEGFPHLFKNKRFPSVIDNSKSVFIFQSLGWFSRNFSSQMLWSTGLVNQAFISIAVRMECRHHRHPF